MDHQTKRHMCRTVLRPFDDELFGARVEIALMERGRIDRVEQASKLAHAYLDPVSAWRDDIASGGCVRHFDSSDYSNRTFSMTGSRVFTTSLCQSGLDSHGRTPRVRCKPGLSRLTDHVPRVADS